LHETGPLTWSFVRASVHAGFAAQPHRRVAHRELPA
jgi:hypothetical protein